VLPGFISVSIPTTANRFFVFDKLPLYRRMPPVSGSDESLGWQGSSIIFFYKPAEFALLLTASPVTGYQPGLDFHFQLTGILRLKYNSFQDFFISLRLIRFFPV
jgi:hypothetical protein